MIESKDMVIGDNEYTITQFTATKGLRYLKSLIKILAPSFAALAGESGMSNMEVKEAIASGTTDTANFATAVSLLVENMDKEDVVELIKNLMQSVRKNGADINFEMEFAGNYGELAVLLTEVCKYNYASVFQGSGFDLTAI